MIDFSQSDILKMTDPLKLQPSESIEVNSEEEEDFEGLIQGYLNPDVAQQSKSAVITGNFGQPIAEKSQATEILAMPNQLGLEQKVNKDLEQEQEQEQEIIESEEVIILNDVYIEPVGPEAHSENENSPIMIAQQLASTSQIQPVTIDTALKNAAETKIPESMMAVTVTPEPQVETKVVSSIDQTKTSQDDIKLQKSLKEEELSVKFEASTDDMPDEKLEKVGNLTSSVAETLAKSDKDTSRAYQYDATSKLDTTAILSKVPSNLVTNPQAKAQGLLHEQIIPSTQQSEAWGKALNEKLVMMAKQGVEKALIQIDPPELGPIEVILDMEGNTANLQFTASNQQVKELIESQIQQLRNDFNSDAMNLQGVTVEQHQYQDQSKEHTHFRKKTEPEPALTQKSGQDSDGLLDIYV